MGFPIRTLGDLCDEAAGVIRTGPFGSQLHESDYTAEGVPVVMPKDLIGGSVADDSIARVDEKTAERLALHRLLVGDIVYGRRGDIGRRALISGREAGWLCGTGCLRISIHKPWISSAYLYYYLGAPTVVEAIAKRAVGATMLNLNTSILREVDIVVPPREIQGRIADILSAYDDLIENNTKRIKLLEEMARSLYREWFVNLRFPGHEKVKLVNSPGGKVPEGWTAGTLGDVVTLQRGFDLPERERRSGSVPVVSSSGITGTHEIAKVDAPGIVTGRYGTLGEVYLIREPFWPLNTTLFVKDFKGSNPYWLLYLLRSMNFSHQNAAGAVPGINRNALHLLGVYIAPRELQACFGSLVGPLLQQVEVMQRRNKVLAGQRDILLPRLISGESNMSCREAPGA